NPLMNWLQQQVRWGMAFISSANSSRAPVMVTFSVVTSEYSYGTPFMGNSLAVGHSTSGGETGTLVPFGQAINWVCAGMLGGKFPMMICAPGGFESRVVTRRPTNLMLVVTSISSS